MAHEWVPAFLASLSGSPNVSAACQAAGIERSTAYRHRDSDGGFAAAWDDALEVSTDDLVGEAYRRARHGTDKPVFHMGDQCGSVREYSDTLTIFLLKAHRPAVYRETVKQEFSGVNGAPLFASQAQQRFTENPRVAELQCELDELTIPDQVPDPGGLRGEVEPGPVGDGAPPGAAEPQAD